MQFNVTSTPQTSFGKTLLTLKEGRTITRVAQALRNSGLNVCVKRLGSAQEIAQTLGEKTVAIFKAGPHQFGVIGNNAYTDRKAFDVVNNMNKVNCTYRA